MRTREEIMRRIREVVKHNLSGISHVYLYGSRARGEASVDSDWDVLIILDKPQIDQSDYDNVTYPIKGTNGKAIASPPFIKMSNKKKF